MKDEATKSVKEKFPEGTFTEENDKARAKIRAQKTLKGAVHEYIKQLVKAGQAIVDRADLTPEEKLAQLSLAGAAAASDSKFETAWDDIRENTGHR